MKLTVLAAVAAIGIVAFSLTGNAATMGAATVEAGTAHVITPAACVWRRVWIPRHVRPNGRLVRGHWSHHRRRVCR